MRMLLTVCALGVGVLLSADASAQTVRLTAVLSGGEETPAAINTGAFGTAEVVFNTGTNEGTVTVTVWNLPSGATGGHIHVGPKGTGGPVIWDLNVPNNISNDFTVTHTITSGNLRLRPDQGIRSFDDAVQALLGGNTYVNVHSAVNPGGEVRGQLTRP